MLLPVPNRKVVFKALPDGAVLLSTDDEVYFALNTVGARVWELLPPRSATLADLCSALAMHYPEVDPGVIDADVRRLLDELTANRLVLPHTATMPDDQADAATAEEAGSAESVRVR
jgi:hypothetical protein